MTDPNGIDTALSTDRLSASWHLRVLRTPLRSHFACGIVAGLLIAILTWIWIHPALLAGDHSHPKEQIADAISLISHRQSLQNRFNEATSARERCQQRIDEISLWLPTERSWESIRAELRAVAAATDVQLISLDRGKTHNGTRVSVIGTRCEINGTYNNVCSFLAQLVEIDSPIWCDEVRIVRNSQRGRLNEQTAASDQPVECLATLSLRAPFAGRETTAGKLLQRSTNNEL